MNAFMNILSASLIAIFVQNSIFERALGINVLLYASRKKEHLLGFFAAITYVTTISAAIIWNFDRVFIESEYYYIFMPILYVAVVSVVYIVSGISLVSLSFITSSFIISFVTFASADNSGLICESAMESDSAQELS